MDPAEWRGLSLTMPLKREAPPLLSVFAWLTNMLGGAMWAIKVWPSLVGALTYVLVGRLVLHLGGRWFALVLAWIAEQTRPLIPAE